MKQKAQLASRIREIGFRCQNCGGCCREISPDSNLVMVGPAEIRKILEGSDKKWDDVAEPFPDVIQYSDGSCVTFEWCIKRENTQCIFLDRNRCSIYEKRPWLCQSFPFALDGDALIISDCPGIGEPMRHAEAEIITEQILRRSHEEAIESEKIRDLLKIQKIPKGDLVIIDSETITVFDKNCDNQRF